MPLTNSSRYPSSAHHREPRIAHEPRAWILNQQQLFARELPGTDGLTFRQCRTATGYQEAVPATCNPSCRPTPGRSTLAKFANQSDKSTEHQTSILQALTLMNGKLVADATSLERSETLAAVTDAPFMDLNERIETLYLATLSRRPSDKELARLVQFVDAEKDRTVALADVFWALLNSGEFMLTTEGIRIADCMRIRSIVRDSSGTTPTTQEATKQLRFASCARGQLAGLGRPAYWWSAIAFGNIGRCHHWRRRARSPGGVSAKLGIAEEEADESIYWMSC